MTQVATDVRNIVARSGYANPITLDLQSDDEDYIQVYADDELLVRGADYVIDSLNPISVTILGADDIDNYVGYENFTLAYNPAMEQAADFSSGGVQGRGFEAALDAQNRKLQAVADRVNRALLLPPYVRGPVTTDAPLDGQVPVWNEAEQHFTWAQTPEQSAESAEAAAASAAAALASEGAAGASETAAAESEAAAAAALAAIEALTSGVSAFWLSVVAATSAAASWLLLQVLGHLTTRTLIKALVPSAGMAVFLSEAGREGTFVWRTGDYSALVTADTAEGIYLKADSVAASTGVWVRACGSSWQASWFGAVGDGTTDDTAAIQAGIDLALGTPDSGELVLAPQRSYKNTGDITISGAASSPNAGSFRLVAYGVLFAGSGDVILDSCKRVRIEGLDAPTSDIRFRGAWHCALVDCRVQRLIVGDADGTNFSSFAWNRIEGGYYQALIFSASMSSYANHNTVHSAQFTGVSGQGFTGTANYAVEVLTPGTVQNLVFDECDLSYYNTAIYSAGTGTADLELRFIRCYFDSAVPKPLYLSNRLVQTIDCHVAGKFRYLSSNTLSAQMRAAMVEDGFAYSFGWAPYAGENLLPNGDLALKQTDYVGRTDSPIQSSGSITVTEGASNGRYLRLASSGSTVLRWRVPATPVLAPYTATFIMRGHSAQQSVNVGLNGSQFFSVVVGTEWQVVQIGLNEEVAAGSTFDVTFGQVSGVDFDVDVRYADVHVGKAGGPIKLPQSASAKALTSYGLYTPTLSNTTNVSSSTAASCAWSRNGDMVTVCGSFRVTPTAAAGTETLLGFSLPVPTDFSGSNECGGAGAPNSVTGAMFNEAWSVFASSANDTAVFIAAAQTNTDHSIAFSFSYRVMV